MVKESPPDTRTLLDFEIYAQEIIQPKVEEEKKMMVGAVRKEIRPAAAATKKEVVDERIIDIDNQE